MKKILALLILFISITSCKNNANAEFINHTKNDYSIDYPENWSLDISKKYSTEFLILSEVGLADKFAENVNLTINNLPKQNATLSELAEMSIKELATVPKSKIIKSEVIQKNGSEFHEVEWKGYVTNKDLHFKQYYFIKNNKSYILTFTALQSTYDEYAGIATKILDSFSII